MFVEAHSTLIQITSGTCKGHGHGQCQCGGKCGGTGICQCHPHPKQDDASKKS